MLRVWRLFALAAMMLLTACGPALPSGPILPTFLPSAATTAPEVNEAYPTAQAVEPVATQSVGGFAIRLERAWRDGKQVNADVCFTPPDTSDWTIWSAHLDYTGNTVSEFSTAMTSQQDAGAGLQSAAMNSDSTSRPTLISPRRASRSSRWAHIPQARNIALYTCPRFSRASRKGALGSPWIAATRMAR